MFYSFNYHSSVFWLKEKEIFGTKDRTITVILSKNDSKFSKNCSREDLFPGRSDDAAWGPRSPRSFSRSPRCRFPEQAKITGLTPTCFDHLKCGIYTGDTENSKSVREVV